MIKSRIFNIMQYERHPETGEVLLTEEKIKDALSHRTIKRWAYVLHNEDVFSALDEEHDERHIKGQKKPQHWHIVIEMGSNQVEVGVIAKWFGISDNYVGVAKGAGAFLDCVQYLTHEDLKQQGLGKRLYDDSYVISNFDFRKALNERIERKLKYGRDLTDKDSLRYEVLYNGMTLRQARTQYELLYMEDMTNLKRMRLDYLSMQKPPTTRINYYVCGKGGEGKGLLSRGIARSLFPDLTDDMDIFFEVGAKGAAFEGYDGQPVIIWNDRRSKDLLEELNGRGNVFNVFDTHPTQQKQSIKYGSVNLCNRVNIVNSVQPWADFIGGLAGEYRAKDGTLMAAEDLGQALRRFPVINVIHESDYDMLINKGFALNDGNYDQFFEYKHIQGNFKRIAQRCQGMETLQHQLEAAALAPVIQQSKRLMSREQDISEDEIMREFDKLGTYESVGTEWEDK